MVLVRECDHEPDAPSSHDQFSVRSRHITGMANDRYSCGL
ncbi:Uncharacterised protein [Shigella sonnei]|nr:Uncharacterised protein [Shigella sonnei]